MDILVVGSGGREHALIRKLKESPRTAKLYTAPGNGGIAADAVCVDIAATDIEGMVRFAREQRVDLAVIAPDNPLVMGMADAMQEANIPVFGPTAAAAAIEGSKAFSKDLMRRYHIPTAEYTIFDDFDSALDFLRRAPRWPLVVKADGLALGKGVVVAQSPGEAEDALRAMMRDRVFGESGSRVVIEEFLEGTEVSVLALTDGETLLPLAPAMDHKRAFDGDCGPNTGGMGAVAPHPLYTPEVAARCMEEIFIPTIRAMRAEGRTFRGCLFFGLMLTAQGPKVIEYNCRFGDPETQVVLPLLEGDLPELMLAASRGRLREATLRQKPGAAACVVLASAGYPGAYRKGLPIDGLDETGQAPDVVVCHSGTQRANAGYVTNGGRVLGVCATGNDLRAALDAAYRGVSRIGFEGAFYRRDIGQKVL